MNTLCEPELNDLESLAEIFNAYRVFYHQEPNIDLARKFIHERITQKDSKIFIKNIPIKEASLDLVLAITSKTEVIPTYLLRRICNLQIDGLLKRV